MNHKWVAKYKKHELIHQDCSMCGCERIPVYYGGKLITYYYYRSDLVLTDRPDCIDWEVENKKNN